MSKKKYYAVRKGRNPGIYSDWFGDAGAEAQVKGFNGAEYKGFPTLVEAETWLDFGMDVSNTGTKQQRSFSLNQKMKNEDAAFEFDLDLAMALGKVVIYTDGACEGNPGPGGYGVVVQCKEERIELSQGYSRTTNNRMELLACITGLEALKHSRDVVLFSDSKYVVNGINNGWAARWRENAWMRNKKEKAENSDLWGRLLDLCEHHKVEFAWVRGHSGNEGNERVDYLAVQAIRQTPLLNDTQYVKSKK